MSERRSDQAATHIEPLLLNSRQVATLLGVSLRTVERMTARGDIPCVRLPLERAVRFDREAVRRWIKQGCPRPSAGSRPGRKRHRSKAQRNVHKLNNAEASP
jgi:excisionase family DNA binding protein